VPDPIAPACWLLARTASHNVQEVYIGLLRKIRDQKTAAPQKQKKKSKCVIL